MRNSLTLGFTAGLARHAHSHFPRPQPLLLVVGLAGRLSGDLVAPDTLANRAGEVGVEDRCPRALAMLFLKSRS